MVTGNFSTSKNQIDHSYLRELKEVATKDDKSCLKLFDSQIDGLSPHQLIKRREKLGFNEIASEKAPAWYKQLLLAFITPFNGVLILIAAVTFVTNAVSNSVDRDYKTIVMISAMILLSSLLRFWQEFRSNRAAEKLKRMIKTTATVLRENVPKEDIDIRLLVPGDIIFLSAGDMIPGDCRVLQSKDLFVGQAVLTGESLPVEKREPPVKDAADKTLLELDNICFMGTNVVNGSATALIITTGNRTYFGSISKSITSNRSPHSFFAIR